MSKPSRATRRAIMIVAATFLASAPLSTTAATWSITDLGVGFNPADINDHGTVLRGQQVIEGQTYDFTAINNLGQAVGNDSTGAAVLYEKGTLTRLNGLRDAMDLNDAGQVIGAATSNGTSVLAVWTSGVVTTPLGSHYRSSGRSITSEGVVLGNVLGIDGRPAAVIYDGSDLTPITLGGSDSFGSRINDRGVVVGFATVETEIAVHAFLHRHGVTSDLGTLGGWNSFAQDANNRNAVVGYSEIDLQSYASHAFLYRRGEMLDLSTLPEVAAAGWSSLDYAYAMNDRGQIVGRGMRNGEWSGFLLERVSHHGAAPIPEPGTFALALAGLALLCICRPRLAPKERAIG